MAEVHEQWAIRWPDGQVSGALYSDDGSDFAENSVRSLCPSDAEVVHRTVTIDRTEWAAAEPRTWDEK